MGLAVEHWRLRVVCFASQQQAASVAMLEVWRTKCLPHSWRAFSAKCTKKQPSKAQQPNVQSRNKQQPNRA